MRLNGIRLRSGYAKGDRSFTPASLGRKKKIVEADVEAEAFEAFGDSDDIHEIETRNNDIQPYIVLDNNTQSSMVSSKMYREEDIDACLDQLRRSSASQYFKPKNPYEEVLNILESMGIVEKYGEPFAVDILDSFRSKPGAIDLFTSLRSDAGRLHYLRKYCVLEDGVYVKL